MYPVVSRDAVNLQAASSDNVLATPVTTAIGENEFTQGVGFGSLIFDVLITFLEDASTGAGITIETSGTRDFLAVTVPELRSEPPILGGLIDNLDAFTEGQTIVIKNLEGNGWWRVKNEMDAAISVSYRVKPNRT